MGEGTAMLKVAPSATVLSMAVANNADCPTGAASAAGQKPGQAAQHRKRTAQGMD